MKTHCDRCGKDCRWVDHGRITNFVPDDYLTTLISSYSKWGVLSVCKSCGDKCNSFVSYYGVKKYKDKLALMYFLQSGKVSKPLTEKAYSGLMNGGYFSV